MKTESDPIETEVNRILKEMYSPYLRHIGKQCREFCGDNCTCERRISVTERERVRYEVKVKMRV